MPDDMFFVLYRQAPGDAWEYDSYYTGVYVAYTLADQRALELRGANPTWEVAVAEATTIFPPKRQREEEDE